ncbi:hypothetical protein GXW82_03440 [Streptacidiphilus sp. 4-A2]|nr:hypothetical protein [Streptacidiphilus sp. 4-A2]
MGVPNVIQHVFEGEGRLSPEALAGAVATVAEVCPGPGCAAGAARVDSGIAPAVRVLELPPGQELLADPALQTTSTTADPPARCCTCPATRPEPSSRSVGRAGLPGVPRGHRCPRGAGLGGRRVPGAAR